MHHRGLLLFSLLALTGLGCAEEQTTLLIELVPNPEYNTRADVAEHLNRLDVIFDTEEGFAGLDAGDGERWGPFLATDFDGDPNLELLLTRQGRVALDPFAISQGSQGERMIRIIARGVGTRGTGENAEIVALGSAAGAFEPSQQTQVEVGFNLIPAYRPLRVLEMTPPQGAQDLEPGIINVTIKLSGEVLQPALENRVELRAHGADQPLTPTISVSNIDDAMGRMTYVRLKNCTLYGGSFTVTLDTEICSTKGQCLDQHLSIDDRQAFEGSFSVNGDPEPAICTEGILTMSCPAIPCEPGFECIDGECVQELIERAPEGVSHCDPELCKPPRFMCDPTMGCLSDCRFYSTCMNPETSCNPDSGLCLPM